MLFLLDALMVLSVSATLCLAMYPAFLCPCCTCHHSFILEKEKERKFKNNGKKEVLEFWSIGILEFWNFGFFGFLDFWIFVFLDFWIFGFLDFWIFGFLDFWIFGFLDFWIFGFLDFWICILISGKWKYLGPAKQTKIVTTKTAPTAEGKAIISKLTPVKME
jgi:hypothetical protein